jgi:hypothetical protein
MGSARQWRRVVALAACVPVWRLAGEARLGLDHLMRDGLADDAFYYFVIARHIPEFNSGISCSGFHPLYAALIAPFHLALDPEAAIVASLGCLVLFQAIGALLVHHLLSTMWSSPIAGTCAVAWACSGQLYLVALSGVEAIVATACALLLLTRIVEVAARPELASLRDMMGVGGLCGLAFLARMDSPIVVAPFMAWLLIQLAWRGRAGEMLALVLSSAVIPSAWLAYVHVATGQFLPTSMAALRLAGAGEGSGVPWERSVRLASALVRRFLAFLVPEARVAGWGGPIAVAAVAGALLMLVGLGLRTLRDRPDIGDWTRVARFSALITCGLSAWAAYYCLFQGTLQFWYAGHLALLAYATALPLLLALAYRFAHARAALAVSAAMVLLAATSHPPRPLFPQEYDKYQAALALKVVFGDPPERRIGAFNTGIYKYFSGLDVINLDGVVNPRALEALRGHDLPRYVHHERIGYLIEQDDDEGLRWVRDDPRFTLTRWLDLSRHYRPYAGRYARRTYLWLLDVKAAPEE